MSFEPDTLEGEVLKLKKQIRDTNNSIFYKSDSVNLDRETYNAGSVTGATGNLFGALAALSPVIISLTDDDNVSNPHVVHSTGVFDKINPITSSSVLVQGSTSTLNLRYILGTVNNGQLVFIRPVTGKTLVLKSGGNINTLFDIVVKDGGFTILQYYTEANVNKYNVLLGGEGTGPGSGDGSGTIDPNDETTPATGDSLDINYVIDGGGAVIKTGLKGGVWVHFNCRIQGWIISSWDVSGSASVNVRRAAYPSFPSTLSFGAVTLSSQQKNTGGPFVATLIDGGNNPVFIGFEVTSASLVKRLTITLKCRKI